MKTSIIVWRIIGIIVLASITWQAQALSRNYAFGDAARRGDTFTVHQMLNQGIKPDVSVGKGMTALRWACSNGHMDVINLLLDYGANPNPPLGHALYSGNHNVTKLLIMRGAIVTGVQGDNALEKAQAYHWIDVVNLIQIRRSHRN